MVARGALETVEGDLDHLLGTYGDDPPVVLGRQLGEAGRLPGEHLVGHALERLAEHDEAICRTRPEVDVRQRSAPPSGAAFDGKHHEIERVPGFHFDPGTASAAGCVRGCQVLDHYALMACGDLVVEEPLSNIR